VCSAGRGTDAIEFCEVFRGPSVAISSQLLHQPRFTATVIPFLLVGVCTVLGRFAFTCAMPVTIHISVRRCPSSRNSLAPG
jgi:hypothetical protein